MKKLFFASLCLSLGLSSASFAEQKSWTCSNDVQCQKDKVTATAGQDDFDAAIQSMNTDGKVMAAMWNQWANKAKSLLDQIQEMSAIEGFAKLGTMEETLVLALKSDNIVELQKAVESVEIDLAYARSALENVK